MVGNGSILLQFYAVFLFQINYKFSKIVKGLNIILPVMLESFYEIPLQWIRTGTITQ